MARRSAKKTAVVLGLSALGSVLALEVGFRALVEEKPPQPLRYEFSNRMGGGGDDLFAPSETRFWRLHPGAVEPMGDAINALGMRGREPEVDEPASVFRVAALGDSCTYGVSLGVAQTFPARLEARLSALFPDRRVEVLNAGVPGYTLYQGAETYREVVRPLAPDAVVLWFGAWNDQNPAFGASDIQRGRHGAHPVSRFERVYKALSFLRSVQWAGDRWAGTLRHRHWRASVDEWFAGEPAQGYRVPESDFRALLEEVLDACAEDGTEALLVLPVLNEVQRPTRERCFERVERYRAILADTARRRGLATVDLREILPSADHAGLFLQGDAVHPGARANAWIALEVARAMAEWASATAPAASLAPALASAKRSATRGGELAFRIDLGRARAGASWRLAASLAPSTWSVAVHPDAPLVRDALGRALEPLTGRLDADGRAQVALTIPASLPELEGARAVGFALALEGPAGPEWVAEAWLPFEERGAARGE